MADPADRIAIVKASKVGVSEILVCEVLSRALAGIAGLYILPDQLIRNRFITTRIDRLIHGIPAYRGALNRSPKDVDEKGLKTIFGTTWAFAGSNNPTTFYEYNSAINIFDEYDQILPESILVANDRTGAAARDRWWKVGNPTVTGQGIEVVYAESDQKTWHVQCEHCNHWQMLTWEVHFVEQTGPGVWRLRDSLSGDVDARPVCEHCQRPFNRLGHGAWVAANPTSPISGYRISRLFGAPGNDDRSVPARPIIRETFEQFIQAQSNPTALQVFYNNRLGLPYEAEGAKITHALLAACAADYHCPSTGANTFAGVDVGKFLHVHIEQVGKGGVRRKLFVGTCRDANDLQVLCHQYGVRTGVIDGMPEEHLAREWCETHSGWYRCYYSQASAAAPPTVDHVAKRLACNRTATLDASYADYSERRVELPLEWQNLDNGDFLKQMTAATRLYIEDKDKFEWREGTLADHHQHADNYCRLAGSMFGSGLIFHS